MRYWACGLCPADVDWTQAGGNRDVARSTHSRPVRYRTPNPSGADGGAGTFGDGHRGGERGRTGLAPSALLSPGKTREELEKFRAATKAPVNLSFFCHTPPETDESREAAWRKRLAPYYAELGVDPAVEIPVSSR